MIAPRSKLPARQQCKPYSLNLFPTQPQKPWHTGRPLGILGHFHFFIVRDVWGNMTRMRIELGPHSIPMSECEILHTSRIFIFLQLFSRHLSQERVLLEEKGYYLVLLFSFEGFMGFWYAFVFVKLFEHVFKFGNL